MKANDKLRHLTRNLTRLDTRELVDDDLARVSAGGTESTSAGRNGTEILDDCVEGGLGIVWGSVTRG